MIAQATWPPQANPGKNLTGLTSQNISNIEEYIDLHLATLRNVSNWKKYKYTYVYTVRAIAF